GRDRQCQKQSIHWTNLQYLIPWKDDARRMGGRVRDPPCVYVSLGASALHPPSCCYGMGGLGKGKTPQTAAAQGGSGGVGIRESFPWVDAEAFAVPAFPIMNVPVKVLMLGKGVVKPSVRVCRKATIWFSS